MKIAVLGTGMVGQSLAGRLAELGHEVTVGTRDVAATLARTEPGRHGQPALPRLGRRPTRRWRLATFAEAAAGAGAGRQRHRRRRRRSPSCEAAGRDNLAGKVLLDIANPLDFSQGFPPTPVRQATPTPSASRSRRRSPRSGWSRRSTR